MQELIIYLVKSAGLLSLFYAGYFFLLKKDTAFRSNRFYLLTGISVSLLLPFLEITRTVEAEARAIPVFLETLTENPPSEVTEVQQGTEWWQVVALVYLIGLGIFLLKFVLELISLLRLIYTYKTFREGTFHILKKKGTTQPFSFFKYIILDPDQHSPIELDLILSHEKSHARQWHSIDQLLSSLFVYLLWFNPLAWLYKKAVVQNLEFLADQEVVSKEVSKKDYQKTLLKISVPGFQPAFTNQFYQSFIKKRIMMLNRNVSQKSNFWKSSFLLPFLIIYIFSFAIKTEAREVPEQQVSTLSETSKSKKPKGPLAGLGRSPLYIIAGKEYKTSELEEKYVEVRGDWSVLKPEEAVKKYGRKAKDGVILISESNIIDDFKEALKSMDLSQVPVKQTFIEVKKGESPVLVGLDFNIGVSQTTKPMGFEAQEIDFHRKPEDIIAIQNDGEQFYVQNKKPLVVIEGEVKDEDFDVSSIDPSIIKTLTVLKGHDATEKYAEKGKNGVIEIDLKSKEEQKTTAAPSEKKKKFETISASKIEYKQKRNHLSVRDVGSADPDATKPLYVLDGKEMGKDFNPDTISEEDIELITVLKGDKATAKYGDRASNGVIEITTKQ